MKIRSRLLLLFLPTVLAIIVAISFISYYAWHHELISQVHGGLILLGAVGTIVLMMTGIAFIADNISQPVEQLKNAALTLAAGNYGKKIEVKGPQEISELANILNTMSECLSEHLTRLEENSLLREKMIGEVEAYRLLQTRLIQGIADTFSHHKMRIRALCTPSKAPQRAAVLEIVENKDTQVTLRLRESNFIGFDGIYELMHGSDACPEISVGLTKQEAKWQLQTTRRDMPEPIIWSTDRSETVIVKDSHTAIQSNDFIIIINQGLDSLIRDPVQHSLLHHSFHRVFRHFAEEGIDACATLLANELSFLESSFLAKQQEKRSPLIAICIQIL